MLARSQVLKQQTALAPLGLTDTRVSFLAQQPNSHPHGTWPIPAPAYLAPELPTSDTHSPDRHETQIQEQKGCGAQVTQSSLLSHHTGIHTCSHYVCKQTVLLVFQGGTMLRESLIRRGT